MVALPTGPLGYAFDKEDRASLITNGVEASLLLKQYQDTFPEFNVQANPVDVFDILNQGNQGACQGHALAGIFSVCYYLATGRKEAFSRACGYYISQRFDGIRSDQGSTLNGGRKVATEHGMCLEKDWKYPSRYNPTEPPNLTYPYKLKVSKPFSTVQEVLDWLDSGLPIQIGLLWNSTCEQEVVNNWRPLARSGGHSTFYWQRSSNGNVKMINSWGKWNEDGVNEWTEGAIAAALKHQWTVMIGYAPDEMSYPTLEPIS